MAWSTATGDVLPAFPQRVEDLQFLSAPAIADIDGDGIAELLVGSGGYYLHAFSGTGGEPAGWPKFTGGWTIGSLAVGDLDGDGLLDVVAPTREGRLYAWESASSTDSAIQWASFAHDAHRTGNVSSGVLVGGEPAGCASMYRGIVSKVSARYGAAAADDKLNAKGRVNIGAGSLDPSAVPVNFTWGSPLGVVYSAEIPAGSFEGNSKGTSFKFSDPTLIIAPGIKKAKIKLKKGIWGFQVQAASIDAELPSDLVSLSLRVGDLCVERSRRCALKPNGLTLTCK